MQATLKEKKYIVLALAVIVHALLFAFLFLPTLQPPAFLFPVRTKTEHPLHTYPDLPDTAELKKDWAARQAPAPTVFYDDPQAETLQDEQHTDTQTDEVQDLTPEELKLDQEPLQEAPPLPLPNSQAKPDTVTTHAIEEIKESPKKKVSLTKKQALPQKKPRRAKNNNQLKLADLAQSFMEKMNGVPVGQLFMQGNTLNMPPDKQIIFERYRTKVGTIIAQVLSEHPFPLQAIPTAQLHIYLELNREGRFSDLHMVQSSGNDAADNYALFIYSEASKRFPPIPESLDLQLFKGVLRLSYYKQKPGDRQNKNLFLFD